MCSAPIVIAQPPGAPVCGDGYRDPGTEECDDGSGNGLGACSTACEVADLVLAAAAPDAGAPQETTFGGQPHPISADAWGFAGGFALGSSPPTELRVAFFDGLGKPLATRVVSKGSTLYPAGTGVALAALGCGRYAAAWTDYGDDGDGAGVALRLVDPGVAVAGPPGHANAGTSFDQVLQDMIWTGSEVVVAWADDADASSLGLLRVRTFDGSLSPTSPDQVLAHTSGLSASAVLAPFAGSWAAAWISYEDGGVSVLARAGTVSWSAGSLGVHAMVDRPAIVDLDDTHLLLVYAASASAGEPATLRGAILDTAAPGSVSPFAIPTVAVPPGADTWEPSLARVGSRVFLSWLSSTGPSSPEPLPGDLWLKEMAVGPMPGTVDASLPEIALPRSANDATGMQRTPVFAAVSGGASPLLLAAWQDHEGAEARVLAEAIPVPILRKAGQ